MPLGAILDEAEAITPPLDPTTKGGSRYVLVPADWPKDARVRLILLTQTGGPPP